MKEVNKLRQNRRYRLVFLLVIISASTWDSRAYYCNDMKCELGQIINQKGNKFTFVRIIQSDSINKNYQERLPGKMVKRDSLSEELSYSFYSIKKGMDFNIGHNKRNLIIEYKAKKYHVKMTQDVEIGFLGYKWRSSQPEFCFELKTKECKLNFSIYLTPDPKNLWITQYDYWE